MKAMILSVLIIGGDLPTSDFTGVVFSNTTGEVRVNDKTYQAQAGQPVFVHGDIYKFCATPYKGGEGHMVMDCSSAIASNR